MIAQQVSSCAVVEISGKQQQRPTGQSNEPQENTARLHLVLDTTLSACFILCTGTALSYLVQPNLLAMLLVHTATSRQKDTGSRLLNVILSVGGCD